jgi:hypothetical protein
MMDYQIKDDDKIAFDGFFLTIIEKANCAGYEVKHGRTGKEWRLGALELFNHYELAKNGYDGLELMYRERKKRYVELLTEAANMLSGCANTHAARAEKKALIEKIKNLAGES